MLLTDRMPQPTSPGTAIVVLGMHRSGTSATAGLLGMLGAELGSRLMPPGPDNPKGFWENLDVVDINDALLAGLDRRWDDVRDMPKDWMASAPATEARAAIATLVEREFAHAPLWAIKDPRLCRTAALWRDALIERDVRPAFLLLVRHPEEVVASLDARSGVPLPESARLLWLRHLIEAERASRGCNRCLITYEELLGDWRACVDRITSELDLSWPISPKAAQARIHAFLGKDGRHHAFAGPVPDDALAQIACKVYTDLLDRRTSIRVWQSITQLADRLRRIPFLQTPLIEELAGEHTRIARLNAAMKAELQAAIDARSAWALDLDQRLEASQEAHARAVAEHAKAVAWAQRLTVS
jgi:hypothetical protein